MKTGNIRGHDTGKDIKLSEIGCKAFVFVLCPLISKWRIKTNGEEENDRNRSNCTYYNGYTNGSCYDVR